MTRASWAVAGWLLLSSAAEARPATERAPARPAADGQPLQSTGYMLSQGQLELGLLFAGYGITDWLLVGIQPIPWVVAPILGGASANAAVKLGIPLGSMFNVALDVNPIWFQIETNNTNARGILLPITFATSFHPSPRQHYSLAVRYSSAEGLGEREIATQEVGGTALTRLVQLVGQTQFQLTRAVALYVQGLLQVWEQELHIEGRSRIDARTRVDIEGRASSAHQPLPWAAVAGAHLRFGAVNLRLGAGYGNIFVPRIGLATRRYEGVLPDLDFYVRF